MKAGGKKDKLKKYPRIIDYLEVKHPAIYDIINDLSMHGSLTPRKGGAITFLNPDDAYVKEIKKVVESNDPEKAVDMISSLILTDLFEKSEDFASKKDNVSTLYGTKLIIKSISPNKVSIENGEITLDKNFIPFSRYGTAKRGNMAVWNLKGTVKYEGAPKAPPPERRRPGERGGARERHRGGDDTIEQLHQIKKKILMEKLSAIKYEKKSTDGNAWCPMMNAVTRLIRVFRDDVEFYEEYRYARCILTMSPIIDFYLLFCNPLIFSPAQVLAAYKRGIDVDSNADTYRKFCADYSSPALAEHTALLLTSAGVQTITSARIAIHDRIIAKISRTTADQILKVYTECDQKNTIEGKGPVYPQTLSDIFKSNPGLHLMIDEFSYVMYMGLQDYRAAPNAVEKCKRMEELIHAVHDAYGQLDNPAKKTRLDQESSYGMDIDNSNALYQCVINFWRTWGLHMPCNTQANFDDFVRGGSDEAENPYNKELIDVDRRFVEDLDTYDNCPMCLSDNATAELKAYMRAHGGKLPDNLAE